MEIICYWIRLQLSLGRILLILNSFMAPGLIDVLNIY